MQYFTFPTGSYTNDQGPGLPTGSPTLNPITPVPTGYGGVQLNPINTGYTNPFNFVTPNPTPPATTQPVYQPATTPPPATTTQGQTHRAFLLDQVVLVMPKTLGNGGVLFNRAQLDVPNVSDADLQFIWAFLEDTDSFMGTLQKANVLLFQKEVLDDVIRGTDPENAVMKALAAIKANIYLYDATGNPLYDDSGKPIKQTATGSPAAPAKNNTMWLLLGAGILFLLNQ